jgi:hypothetical protein
MLGEYRSIWDGGGKSDCFIDARSLLMSKAHFSPRASAPLPCPVISWSWSFLRDSSTLLELLVIFTTANIPNP